jgi:hypothetical protein
LSLVSKKIKKMEKMKSGEIEPFVNKKNWKKKGISWPLATDKTTK